jgi:hypothetical protein
MTDRPLAKYEDGQLWKDIGGVYYPATRIHVLLSAEMFLTRTDANAKRYVRDCRAALHQYDKAMEEAKCEAATH